MCYNMLATATIVFVVLTAGCSTLKKVIYHPDINQGNYLTPNDILKVRVGMTQQQVAYVLGTPMIYDQFGTDTWFYVFRQQLNHGDTTQRTLTLNFNSNGVLNNIDNKLVLIKQ